MLNLNIFYFVSFLIIYGYNTKKIIIILKSNYLYLIKYIYYTNFFRLIKILFNILDKFSNIKKIW